MAFQIVEAGAVDDACRVSRSGKEEEGAPNVQSFGCVLVFLWRAAKNQNAVRAHGGPVDGECKGHGHTEDALFGDEPPERRSFKGAKETSSNAASFCVAGDGNASIGKDADEERKEERRDESDEGSVEKEALGNVRVVHEVVKAGNIVLGGDHDVGPERQNANKAANAGKTL